MRDDRYLVSHRSKRAPNTRVYKWEWSSSRRKNCLNFRINRREKGEGGRAWDGGREVEGEEEGEGERERERERES